MSGGSYNYLCFKEVDQLRYQDVDIENMARRLDALGFSDLAQATRQLFQDITKAFEELEKKVEPYRDIWRVVEWADSGDTSRKELPDEIRRLLLEKGKP
jgi:hypothetical protein